MAKLYEIKWDVIGNTFPADHNYGLYSAITKSNLNLKEGNWQLLTIPGIKDSKGLIQIKNKSQFGVRCLSDNLTSFLDIPEVIMVGVHKIKLCNPTVKEIQPKTSLYCRICTVKGYENIQSFESWLNLQVPNFKPQLDRKTIKIKRFTIIGFGVFLDNLDTETSLSLQIKGLGGKRKLGCGVFI
jgi:CRISPR-associated protein Cas6